MTWTSALWRMCLLAPLLCACSQVRYVTQAAAGQYDFVNRARDIQEVVASKRLSPQRTKMLAEVPRMKLFGEQHGLKKTKNYTKYVPLTRPEAVWVVSASDPLRFHSRTWSFPIVGSFTYLGWFNKPEADEFAATLRDEGLDVDVRGSQAYSTTGYFEDSVLSSMISRGPEALGELSNVILHESTHATIFVRNQSTLNESIANFVGDTLALLYLSQTVGDKSLEMEKYAAHQEAVSRRGLLFRSAVATLEDLYASKKSDAEKRDLKETFLRELQIQTAYPRPLNNAALIQYRTYHSGTAELAELLRLCANDWQRFIAQLKSLEATAFAKKQDPDVGALLRPLLESQCQADARPH